MLGRRAAALAASAATLGVCAVTAASAAVAYGPPAGWPSLADAALQPADLGTGARIESEAYVKPDSSDRSEYDRKFAVAAVGGKKVLGVEDDVRIAASANAADLLITAFPLGLAIEVMKGPKYFSKQFGFKVGYAKLGKTGRLGVGDNSVGSMIRLGTPAGEIRLIMGVVRVSQVDSLIVLVSAPGSNLGLPDLTRLAAAAASRVKAGLAPQTTGVPAIAGTPAVGQVLTATPPVWLGLPTSVSYVWQRCDATGASCTAIPGATAAAYTVSTDDANATLRVSAGATNAFGTATPVVSAQTAVVAAQTPPSPSP